MKERPDPRVAIAFVPGPAPKVKPSMLERLAREPELALGFVSSVLGSYSPGQALVDISAGARTWSSLYDGELPEKLDVRRRGRGGEIIGWNEVRVRARTPPAEIVPGSLGGSVAAAGGISAYVGPRGRLNREAIVAADYQGRVSLVSLPPGPRVARDAMRLWERAELLVVRFPPGPQAFEGLSALLRRRGPKDLVIAVQQPTHDPRRMLAAGIAGLAPRKNLRSDSTRIEGFVLATDIAPTVLKRLGLRVPDAVAGEPIEAKEVADAGELTSLKDRLAEIGPRRWPVILLGLVGAVLVCAASAFRPGPDRLRRFARTPLLAALWLPTTLLLTGALAPSRAVETLLVALSSGILALATAALLPWPRAIVLPAATTVLSHLVDLALGSALIARSLLGPNPILGARFYGIGNELEITLAMAALLGLGALLALADPRARVWGFAVGGFLLAFLFGWGRLGADVGASVTLAAGTAAAATSALGAQPLRRRLAIIAGAPALALGGLAALDLATGGNAHFTRSVLRAGGLDEVAEVAQRRLELSYDSLGRGLVTLLVILALVALVIGVRERRRLLAPLAGVPGLRAGLLGALVAVVAGALSNDSGPIILLIGMAYLALFVGYAQGAPKPGAMVHPKSHGNPLIASR